MLIEMPLVTSQINLVGESLFAHNLIRYIRNNVDTSKIITMVTSLQSYNAFVFDRPTAHIFSYYPGLKHKLPYVPLGNLPTPITKLKAIGTALQISSLYIKRDDLTGKKSANGTHLFGGNKIRKLEFLLAEALYNRAKTVMALGGVGSNFVAATAAYAELLGLNCICLLKDQPNAHAVQRNLLLMHHHHGQLFWFADDRGRNKAAIELSIENKQKHDDFPYFIVPGGSSPIGTIGYVDAAFELKEQIDAGSMPMPDYIYVAVGSMGTMTGLLLGLKAAGLTSIQVIGVNTDIAEKPQDIADGIVQLFKETNHLLYSLDTNFSLFTLKPEEIIILNNFCGTHYGAFTCEGIQAIKLMQEKENILLDGTYTSKAFAGLLHDIQTRSIQNKTILFWNTWCSDSFADQITASNYKKLPNEFHRYFEQPVQDSI
jgi:D-cysteine desulfhydrase